MELTLTAIHWVYLLLIGVIVAFMAMRRDTTVVCVLGIGIIGLLASGTLSGAVSGTFNSLIYAIKELSGTILIISIIVAMSRLLMETGVNEVMIRPFTGLIRSQEWPSGESASS